MLELIEKLWPGFNKTYLEGRTEAVSFEFLAMACLINATIKRGWTIEWAKLPKSVPLDRWCSLPRFTVGKFGQRSRRTSSDMLVSCLMPRIILKTPEGKAYSVYYQGFPPIESNDYRPDWTILPASVETIVDGDKTKVIINWDNGVWEGTYGTLLNAYGPSERTAKGKLPQITGIIEVSLLKSDEHLKKQLETYKKIYSTEKFVAFLGYAPAREIYETVVMPRSVRDGLNLAVCVEAGEKIFKALFI